MAGQGKATVVFDLDGTLADTSQDLLAAANACFERLGHGALLTRADTLCAFQGGRAMLRLGFARLETSRLGSSPRGDAPLGSAPLGDAQSEADVTREYPNLLQAYSAAIDTHTRLYPGAVVAVQALRDAGFATAICTNKPAGLAETLLQRLSVRHLFDALVGADTLPTRKPDPAPYHLAVQRAGGQSPRSFLLGDTETDRKTGLAAGVPVALVTFGPEGTGVARLAPDALLHHFDDLPALAARLLGTADHIPKPV